MLVNRILLQDKDSKSSPEVYLQALTQTLPVLASEDTMLAARLLDIPSARELASAIQKDYDPELVKEQRDNLHQLVADQLQDQWADLYQQLPMQTYQDSPESRGNRALRNVVLDMALTADVAGAVDWAQQQYDNAGCMTERFGALSVMVNHQVANVEAYLADFYKRFNGNDLVIDLWFSVQASAEMVTPDAIKSLIAHADFDWNTPNRVRSVISAFASQPTVLWTAEGLDIYTGVIKKLDEDNPVLASRILQVLARWNTLAEPRRQMVHEQLVDLQQQVSSKHVLESLDSVLGSASE